MNMAIIEAKNAKTAKFLENIDALSNYRISNNGQFVFKLKNKKIIDVLSAKEYLEMLERW